MSRTMTRNGVDAQVHYQIGQDLSLSNTIKLLLLPLPRRNTASTLRVPSRSSSDLDSQLLKAPDCQFSHRSAASRVRKSSDSLKKRENAFFWTVFSDPFKNETHIAGSVSAVLLGYTRDAPYPIFSPIGRVSMERRTKYCQKTAKNAFFRTRIHILLATDPPGAYKCLYYVLYYLI